MVTPASVWQNLKRGNSRFVHGVSEHPNQGSDHRKTLLSGQSPQSILFGCSDSRLAAEIIFDQGLGDMFVVRTAGHVIDSSVLGSVEYAVSVLKTPLIVILGHDSCGAVRATIKAVESGELPLGFVRDVVEKISPSILLGKSEGLDNVDEFEARHVKETGRLLLGRSNVIAHKIALGELAIVGLTYKLGDGRVHFQEAIGDVGDEENIASSLV